MSATTENKALDQLIKKFTEVSDQTKDLDKVISNFSAIIEEFHVTMLDVDEKMNATDMANLSKEAIGRLKEIKSYNEMQILDHLDSVTKKHLAEQLKRIFKLMNDNTKDSIEKIENQLNELSATLAANITDDKKQEERDKKQDELLSLLQRIDHQTRHSGNGQWMVPPNNEEIIRLRKLVSNLNGKLKRIEENYEDRISQLENEIELLKSEQKYHNDSNESAEWVEIDEDDLPF